MQWYHMHNMQLVVKYSLKQQTFYIEISLNIDSSPCTHTEHTTVIALFLFWSKLWPANSSDPNEWMSRGLTSHSTLYRSFRGRALTPKDHQDQVRKSWFDNNNELKPQLLRVWRDVDSIIYGALMRGVGVFKHVYKQTLESLSNYYDTIYIYSAVWHENFHFFVMQCDIKCHFRNHKKSGSINI